MGVRQEELRPDDHAPQDVEEGELQEGRNERGDVVEEPVHGLCPAAGEVPAHRLLLDKLVLNRQKIFISQIKKGGL